MFLSSQAVLRSVLIHRLHMLTLPLATRCVGNLYVSQLFHEYNHVFDATELIDTLNTWLVKLLSCH